MLPRAPLTIGSARFAFHDRVSSHNLFVDVAINPTRTLNRLLGMYVRGNEWQSRVAFLGWIAEMTAADFFLDPDPAGHAEWDNFIGRPVLAQLEVGRDPFAAFLPIYCVKLENWIDDLLPDEATGSLSIDIEPRAMKVPHCEVYFERRVASAHLVVEHLAHAALASVNSVRAHGYRDEANGAVTDEDDRCDQSLSFNEVERKGAGISVSADLTEEDRSLLIYAKRRDTIRFEVKHSHFTERGDDQVDNVSGGSLAGELLCRMEAARRTLPRSGRWPDVLALARPHEQGSTITFLDLIAALHAAARQYSQEIFERALHDLIVTGGISEIPDEPELVALAETLVRRGILVQRRVRLRDRSGIGKRYVLAEPYLAARETTMNVGSPR